MSKKESNPPPLGGYQPTTSDLDDNNPPGNDDMTEGSMRGGRVVSVTVKLEAVELAMSERDGYVQIAIERCGLADRVRCGDSVYWFEGEGGGYYAYWTDERELVKNVHFKRIGESIPCTPPF